MKKNIVKVVAAVLITAVFAIIAALFTDTHSEWYMSLVKPSIQPPPLAFSIAWSIIYIAFAISLAVTFIKSDGKGAYAYILSLIVTTLWCWIFFTIENIGGALIVIIIAFALSVYLAYTAYRNSLLAGLLITPFALWLGYALAINYGVYLLN